MKKHLQKALGELVNLGDSGLDGRIEALVKSKAPPMDEESESDDESAELTPDEVEKLRRLLAQTEG
jgi:hypothetical protein